MAGLSADVWVLIVYDDGETFGVAATWSEPAAEQALFSWFEKEFGGPLPESHEEALATVHETFDSAMGGYRYDITRCTVKDY